MEKPYNHSLQSASIIRRAVDMKTRLILLWVLFVVAVLAIVAAPVTAQESCANLAKQKYANVTIVSAVFMNDPLGFCRPRHLEFSALPPD
jgi:hypothetical protein